MSEYHTYDYVLLIIMYFLLIVAGNNFSYVQSQEYEINTPEYVDSLDDLLDLDNLL